MYLFLKDLAKLSAWNASGATRWRLVTRPCQYGVYPHSYRSRWWKMAFPFVSQMSLKCYWQQPKVCTEYWRCISNRFLPRICSTDNLSPWQEIINSFWGCLYICLFLYRGEFYEWTSENSVWITKKKKWTFWIFLFERQSLFFPEFYIKEGKVVK